MKNIIFTIDVEGHDGSLPVEHLILGETRDGERCGIDKIMDLLDQYNVNGVFFVDIAEAWDYGADKIAYVLKHIKERGHDVGVHIHPDHMADNSKLFLSEYSYEEQYEIISKCTKFYEDTLGEKPIAFRAGKYSADWNTLKILTDFGYKVDFSQFYGQKWCHIDPPCTKFNAVALDGGLIEIPVTSYMSFRSKVYSRFDKIDASMPFGEYKAVMKQMGKSDSYNIITLFAHSFSFLDWRIFPDNPKFSKSKYKQLEKQLEYAQINEYKFLCLQDIAADHGNFIHNNSEANGLCMEGFEALYYFAVRCFDVIKERTEVKIYEAKTGHIMK